MNGTERFTRIIIPSHMHGKYLRLTQHDNTILSRLAAGGIIICGICSHSHPCSQRIIHDCIQEALPSRISVYRKQAGNSETMTSDQRGIHGTATISGLIHGGTAFTCHHRSRIEQDEHDPWQFCSSTYVDIADNNRKYPFTSISHAIIDRKLNPRPPQAYMTYDRNDGFIPT